MPDIISNFTIPQELIKYYNPADVSNQNEQNFSSNVEVVRNNEGKIFSLKFYSPDKDLVKSLCYEGAQITQVNYYRQNLLYCSDKYNDSLLVEKTVYRKKWSRSVYHQL